MNQLINNFDFKGAPVRVVEKDNQSWFVATDVCRVLEIANGRDAVKALDDDEKNTVGITDGNRGNPNTTVISESGLYALIFKSRKPVAKEFRKWVTSEVLPALREHGRYVVDDGVREDLIREAGRMNEQLAWVMDQAVVGKFPLERYKVMAMMAAERVRLFRIRMDLAGIRMLGN